MRFSVFHIIVLSSSVALAACHSSKKSGKAAAQLPGNWQAQPVVIDGDNKEWPSPYPNYDSKGKIAYATSNDRKYVYITMETGDELTQVKILRAGMTVSIDTSGKKEPQFSINYPLANDNEMLELPQPSRGEKGAHMEKQLTHQIKKLMEQANQFTLEGFSNCSGGFAVSQNTPCGIRVRASIDEYSELVWEAAIPVKALFNKDSLTLAEAGKPISVCMAIKGLKQPKSSGGSEPNNNIGTGGTGMTGMGRGGRGGQGASGRGGAVENPMDHLYTNTKTWKQFGMAVQP